LVLCAAFSAGFVDAIVGGGGLIQLPALLAGYPAIAPPLLLAAFMTDSSGPAPAVS